MMALTKTWLVDATERVVATFVVAYVSVILVAGWSATSSKSALAAGVAAALSLVKALVASQIGNPNSASLVKEVK